METNNIVKALEQELNLTEQGFAALAEQKKGLVIDVSNEAGFKLARKERVERNGIIKNIDRIAIDSKNAIDEARKDLASRVTKIYAPTVVAFENEDAKRKAKAEEDRIKEEERISGIRANIQSIKGMVSQAKGKNASEIGDIIESVDLIDPADNFAEFTQDAIQAIRETLLELNGLLSTAILKEQMDKERAELDAERDEVAKLRAENEAQKAKLAKIEQDAKDKFEADRVAEEDRIKASIKPGPIIQHKTPSVEPEPVSSQDKEVAPQTLSEYQQGYLDGLEAYAWWKSGVQYVGTSGQTLEAASSLFLSKSRVA